MKAAGHRVKLGIEVDYLPGREDRIAALIEGRPWDYVIGSVHFIEEGAVDHDGYDAWRAAGPTRCGATTSGPLGEAARSGLFDVLAHPDLVKIWGAGRPAPSRDPRAFYELALEGIADSDVAIEVSTAGLRKPAGEIYPARDAARHVHRGGPAGRPVVRRARAGAPRLRVRDGARLPAGGGRLAALRVRPPPANRGAARVTVETRVGIGYDSHRFAGARTLVLGGVEFPGEPGLEGHSDADVLTHAVIDAVLGAAGLGDIGRHFPDDDPRYSGADSIELLSAGRARWQLKPAGAWSTSTRR